MDNSFVKIVCPKCKDIPNKQCTRCKGRGYIISKRNTVKLWKLLIDLS
jgi:DnaJ-class molecular chaperone